MLFFYTNCISRNKSFLIFIVISLWQRCQEALFSCEHSTCLMPRGISRWPETSRAVHTNCAHVALLYSIHPHHGLFYQCLARGFIYTYILFSTMLHLLMMTVTCDEDDGLFPIRRAPTAPTTSRMHFSCCCPSCRSPTSRANTADPPQRPQHRFSINTACATACQCVYCCTVKYRE